MTLLHRMIEFEEEAGGRFLEVRVTGKLTKADYETILPELDRLVAGHGKLRILFDMTDFHGWTMAALWKDFQVGMKHSRDIERLAMIGERKWQAWMAAFCRPFTSARIRYFTHDQANQARLWILSDEPEASAPAEETGRITHGHRES